MESLENLTLEDLLNQLYSLQSAVLLRVISGNCQRVSAEHTNGASEDKLLTVEEAAGLLKVSKFWIYRNQHSLPFVVRLGERSIRVSSSRLQQYLETRGDEFGGYAA